MVIIASNTINTPFTQEAGLLPDFDQASPVITHSGRFPDWAPYESPTSAKALTRFAWPDITGAVCGKLNL